MGFLRFKSSIKPHQKRHKKSESVRFVFPSGKEEVLNPVYEPLYIDTETLSRESPETLRTVLAILSAFGGELD